MDLCYCFLPLNNNHTGVNVGHNRGQAVEASSCHMVLILVVACCIVNSRLAAVYAFMQCDLRMLSECIIITSFYRKNYEVSGLLYIENIWTA